MCLGGWPISTASRDHDRILAFRLYLLVHLDDLRQGASLDKFEHFRQVISERSLPVPKDLQRVLKEGLDPVRAFVVQECIRDISIGEEKFLSRSCLVWREAAEQEAVNRQP